MKDVVSSHIASSLRSSVNTRRQQLARAVQASVVVSTSSSSASVSADTASVASAADDTTTEKRSRYLREIDRRSIIHRIDRGEKQAALAKELGVTRAAICHINKNRVEILSRSIQSADSARYRLPLYQQYLGSHQQQQQIHQRKKL
ncbi:Uracil phosphoribosyltransferase [Globisporangium polare]